MADGQDPVAVTRKTLKKVALAAEAGAGNGEGTINPTSRRYCIPGPDGEAAALLDLMRHFYGVGPSSRPPWMLLRGEVNETLERRETAIESYRYVVQSWQDPDPELLHIVSQARDGLRRLGG